MRNLAGIGLGLALVAVFATPALAQSFVGEWTATAHSQGGDVSETLTVAKTAGGYSVTAEPVGEAPGGMVAGPGTDVVLDGDKFSYKRSLTVQSGVIEITYKGEVSGDKFSGSADLGGAQVAYTGVRLRGAK